MFSRPKMVYSAGSTFCFLRGRKVAPDLLGLTHFRMSLWDFADMQSTCTSLCFTIASSATSLALQQRAWRSTWWRITLWSFRGWRNTWSPSLLFSTGRRFVWAENCSSQSGCKLSNTKIHRSYTNTLQRHNYANTLQICKYTKTLQIYKYIAQVNPTKTTNHWKHMLCLVSSANKPFYPFISFYPEQNKVSEQKRHSLVSSLKCQRGREKWWKWW